MKDRTKRRTKRFLLLFGILFLIGCIPIPAILKDGGTRTYNALLYRVIVWHQLTDVPGEYKTGVEFQIIPWNFQPL